MCRVEPKCAEVRVNLPMVVKRGCRGGGKLGSKCAVTCEEGYTGSAEVEGACKLAKDGLSASYVGHSVKCDPETLPDGSLSAAYCKVEAPQVISKCCSTQKSAQPGCSGNNLPKSCSVACAEAWLPLWQRCERNLGLYGALSTKCENTAESFLAGAPSSVTVKGLRCHSYAAGQYTLMKHTFSGKRAWELNRGRRTFLFFKDEPDRWCLGDKAGGACFAQYESYKDLPPWHTSRWKESCGRQDTSVSVPVDIDPGFTANDCSRALRLVSQEINTFCCQEPTDCVKGQPPKKCSYDCARLWWPYSQDCADYLASNFGSTYTPFTAACDRTHKEMRVMSKKGSVGGASNTMVWTSEFGARKDMEYKVEMIPLSKSLLLTGMKILAPHSHHTMASRFDANIHSSGRKVIEWAATQDEAGVEVLVQALEGHGEFQLNVNIEGTLEHLAPQAITSPPNKNAKPTIHTTCEWYDDCVYRYEGQEVRGTGNSFLLRLHGAAGLTYKFKFQQLNQSKSSSHFEVGIFHENSVGGTDAAEELTGADFALGRWTAAGRQTYAQLHKCKAENINKVPCVGDEDDIGDFHTHPGQGPFATAHEFEWPCAATGTYFIEIYTNCDIPFYADTDRCQKQGDDSWKCKSGSDKKCTSATRMEIDVLDSSTTIVQHDIHQVHPDVLIPGSPQEALFAKNFMAVAHPAISYVTEIVPIGLGVCKDHPCQHGGTCVPIPLDRELLAQIARLFPKERPKQTYRCKCTPSWIGTQCEESAEKADKEAELFHKTHSNGGGHRRRTEDGDGSNGNQGVHLKAKKLAIVQIHARGQTKHLAKLHLKNVLRKGQHGGAHHGGKGRRLMEEPQVKSTFGGTRHQRSEKNGDSHRHVPRQFEGNEHTTGAGVFETNQNSRWYEDQRRHLAENEFCTDAPDIQIKSLSHNQLASCADVVKSNQCANAKALCCKSCTAKSTPPSPSPPSPPSPSPSPLPSPSPSPSPLSSANLQAFKSQSKGDLLCPRAQCGQHPCLNGGKCTEVRVNSGGLTVGFKCKCPATWGGPQCGHATAVGFAKVASRIKGVTAAGLTFIEDALPKGAGLQACVPAALRFIYLRPLFVGARICKEFI